MTAIDILATGLGLGVAIAAPVGPIGLLCIRRTLSDGRGAGLASGFGAATADAVYGLTVALGLTATGVLLANAALLQLFGGALIAALGALSIRAFFRRARVEAAAPSGARRLSGLLGAFGSTFLLTLSNPMTILAFVGMVASLGAAAANQPNAPFWLVLGVFLGSALWWILLVHAALIARGRMTPSATRWLDLASGLVLLIWGASLMLRAG